MGKKTSNFSLIVPREFIREENKSEIKAGILMAYCLVNRFGSQDGIYFDSLKRIMKRLGLHYDEKKTKKYPKQLQIVIDGFDYLVTKGAITLREGDYHILDSYFTIKFEPNFVERKKYVSLNFEYFDYILCIEKKMNKTYLLYTLLWVLSNYYVYMNNDEKYIYPVCSYRIEKMAEMMGVKSATLYGYLNTLSVKENGEIGNQPLFKSRPFSFKINGKYIRFPNIYVENKENAKKCIEWKIQDIYAKFKSGTLKNSTDDFAFYDMSNDPEIDELY